MKEMSQLLSLGQVRRNYSWHWHWPQLALPSTSQNLTLLRGLGILLHENLATRLYRNFAVRIPYNSVNNPLPP